MQKMQILSFKLNYSYYPYVFFKNEIDLYLKSYLVNKWAKEQKDLILIYQENLFYTKIL